MCAVVEHGCQHICANLPDGYECRCHPGYQLTIDLKTCNSNDTSLNSLSLEVLISLITSSFVATLSLLLYSIPCVIAGPPIQTRASILPATDVPPPTVGKRTLLLLWWMLTESKVGEISWRKCAFVIIGAAAEMWRSIQGVIVSVNQHKKDSLIFPVRGGLLFFDKSINSY